MTADFMNAAAAYALGGWHVFPCNPAGTRDPQTGDDASKLPHFVEQGKPWRLKWGDRATTNHHVIWSWWCHSPQANIGIAVKPSGLLVVDIDEGPGKVGLDEFDALCERYSIGAAAVWDTYTVRTPRGGYHLYYAWPDGVQASQASIATDVDVRCNGGQKGGYVLAPPSRTDQGEYRVEYDRLPAQVPYQIFELVRERPRPKMTMPVMTGPPNFQGLADTVRCAPDGNRNNSLLWAARTMCEEGADEETADETLVPAATAAGLSEREARSTIRSAYRLQESK
jgi:hypothetical protein